MPLQNHRLYIITGKGGVGKTTIAMALTKFLQDNGVNVKYNCFHQLPALTLEKQLNLPTIQMTIEDSAEIYIAKKLGSKTIASWIMKTHFFKSLFQMIPGFGHMILFGHLISLLENDPSLTIVLDSPASGHALTMFESASNFKAIFNNGLIVKDIDRMQNFLKLPNHLKTFIITLATELSLSEAAELKNELDNNLPDTEAHSEIIINDSFKKFFDLKKINTALLPDFLTQKISLEEEIIKKYFSLPHINQQNSSDIILSLSPLFKDLI